MDEHHIASHLETVSEGKSAIVPTVSDLIHYLCAEMGKVRGRDGLAMPIWEVEQKIGKQIPAADTEHWARDLQMLFYSCSTLNCNKKWNKKWWGKNNVKKSKTT